MDEAKSARVSDAEWRISLSADWSPLAHEEPESAEAPEALPFLAWLMSALKPMRYVYIGAGDCRNYFALCRSALHAGVASQGFAIDTWPDATLHEELRWRHDPEFSTFSGLMRLRWQEAAAHFSDASIDLLCIHAPHEVEAVEMIRAWRPRMSPRSVIVVLRPGTGASDEERAAGQSDIPGAAWERTAGVCIEPTPGVSLIVTGEAFPPGFDRFLNEWRDPEGKEAIRRWFAGFGRNMAEAHALRRRLNDLSRHIAQQDQQIQALEAEPREQAAELESAIARERARLAPLEAQFSGILSSPSWRLTRPLRALLHRVRARLRTRVVRPGAEGAATRPMPDARPPTDRNDYAEWLRRYEEPEIPGTPTGWTVVYANLEKHDTAAALRDAIEACSSEWVVIVTGEGRMAPAALKRLQASVQQHEDVVAVYGDSDHESQHGRHSPQFRCEWNPDLFLSQDYWGPVRALRRDRLVQALDAMPPAHKHPPYHGCAAGAFITDLTLRMIESAEPRQVLHVPTILFHESGIGPRLATNRPLIALHRAMVQGHLNRLEIRAQAFETPHGVHVRYALPAQPPVASLIIPTRNAVALVRQCIESILEKTRYPRYEIILVDNGSDDPEALAYFAKIAEDPRIRILRDDSPFNYSALNNLAAAVASGDILVLVNNDIEVISPDWLDEMISHALRPGIGAVGARLWYPDDRLQHGGVFLGIRGVAAHAYGPLQRNDGGYMGRAQLTQNFSAVTAACLAVRKSLFEQVGGLNERDLTVAFNDIDFCLRLGAAGYRTVWTPHAELYHHESASRGVEDNPQKRARFAAEVHYMKVRWADTLLHDPAYSPNLTLEHDDFSLAWPPRLRNQ